MKAQTRKTLLAASITLIVGIGVVSGVAAYMLYHHLTPENDTYIYIDTDDTIDSVYQKIEQTHSDASFTALRLFTAYSHYDRHIHAHYPRPLPQPAKPQQLPYIARCSIGSHH